ncbi:MAG: SAF domain-containing protein [Candidatus Aceula meridiana]|nr:SAF domain-containing protein [Candidatus Aceula meridiana]
MYSYLFEELQRNHRKNGPIKLAIAGTGFVAGGVLCQLSQLKVQTFFPSVVLYRKEMKLQDAFGPCARRFEYIPCSTKEDVQRAVRENKVAAVKEIDLIFSANVDIVLDLTGDPKFGAELAYKTIQSGVHICASPEMDVAIGTHLNQLAESKGVVYSGFLGDEPGETFDLINYVRLMKFEIVAAGKFKNFTDRHANPESVKPWAEKFKQNPFKISSFADGTKANIEMALVANASGLVPDVAGMHCPEGTFDSVIKLMKLGQEGGILSQSGVVEIISGAEPSGAIFVIGKNSNPKSMNDMKYLKMGSGPYYLFYKAYHLCQFEILIGIAKICLLKLPVIKPLKEKITDVAVYAKKDLCKGEVLDEIGGFTFYGLVQKYGDIKSGNCLPVSAAPGCKLKRDIREDEPITIKDVEYKSDAYLWKLINGKI